MEAAAARLGDALVGDLEARAHLRPVGIASETDGGAERQDADPESRAADVPDVADEVILDRDQVKALRRSDRHEAGDLATRQEILDVQRQVNKALGAKDASIFEAHLLVLEDPTLIE